MHTFILSPRGEEKGEGKTYPEPTLTPTLSRQRERE